MTDKKPPDNTWTFSKNRKGELIMEGRFTGAHAEALAIGFGTHAFTKAFVQIIKEAQAEGIGRVSESNLMDILGRVGEMSELPAFIVGRHKVSLQDAQQLGLEPGDIASILRRGRKISSPEDFKKCDN